MISSVCKKTFFAFLLSNILFYAFSLQPEGRPAQNAESTRPDAALYNIAGTAFLIDGLYLQSGNTVRLTQSSGNTAAFLQPDTLIVWKHDRFSVFGTAKTADTLYSYSQGNRNGISFTQNILQEHAGASYQITEQFSAAAAVICTQAYRKLSGTGSTDGSSSALGAGGLFGLQFLAGTAGRFSLQYDTGTVMSFSGRRDDIPPALKLGTGISVFEGLDLSAGFTWYCNRLCAQDNCITCSSCTYTDGWETGAGFDWRYDTQLGFTGAITWSHGGQSSGTQDTVHPHLSGIILDAGAEYRIEDNLIFSGAVRFAQGISGTYSGTEISRRREELSFSVMYKPL